MESTEKSKRKRSIFHLKDIDAREVDNQKHLHGDACESDNPLEGPSRQESCTSNEVSKAFDSSSDEESDELYSVPFVRKRICSPSITESNHCHKDCTKKCLAQYERLSMEDKSAFGTYLLGPLKQRNSILLKHFSSQRQLTCDLSSNNILFLGSYYCSDFFSHQTGCSKYLINKTIVDSDKGITDYMHGNTAIRRECPKTITFVAWMLTYSEVYGQNSPEERCRILPAFLNKTNLHQIYAAEVEGPVIAYSTFCQHLDSYFGPKRKDKLLPWIKLSSYSSHSVCDMCAAIERHARSCKSREEVEFVMSLKNLHRKKYSRIRISIEALTRLSALYPEDHVTIYIDSMDNNKVRLKQIEQYNCCHYKVKKKWD